VLAKGEGGSGYYFFGVSEHAFTEEQKKCTDGKQAQDPDELGVDCGGYCNPCKQFFTLEFKSANKSIANANVPNTSKNFFTYDMGEAIAREIGINRANVKIKDMTSYPPYLYISAYTSAPYMTPSADFVHQFKEDAKAAQAAATVHLRPSRVNTVAKEYGLQIYTSMLGQVCVDDENTGTSNQKPQICNNGGQCPALCTGKTCSDKNRPFLGCNCASTGFTGTHCQDKIKTVINKTTQLPAKTKTLFIVVSSFFAVVLLLMVWLIIHTRRERRKYNQSVFEMLQAPVQSPASGLNNIYDAGLNNISGQVSDEPF